MSVVGPVSAVAAAAVPVVAGIALGERPPLLALAGIAVALPAIVLVVASGRVRGFSSPAMLDGLAAGVALGFMFTGLAQAGHGAGLWPVTSEQTSSLLYFLATHFAMLATAAVLVSLYPGVTVLLARTVRHERFTPVQRAGLGLCTLAVVAIALS